jgi:lipopolysaccharide/colanic/teichoic acid biosynthesis glycosyltransferase
MSSTTIPAYNPIDDHRPSANGAPRSGRAGNVDRSKGAEAGQSADIVRYAVEVPEASVHPQHSWYPPMKSVADSVMAAILLVVSLPVIFVCALLVRLSSKGPAFYRQTRTGKNGKPFKLIKLRTMIQDAEVGTGAVWSAGENDERITRVGRWLRKTHLDEFPQLINVLLGQMSLVGPRPERPEFVAKLEWEIPYYRERLNVKPGITGLAQLRLPPDTTTDSVRQKLIHDLYYVRYLSPWIDFQLLVVTAWLLVSELLKSSMRFLWLPTQEAIEHGFQQALGVPLRTLSVSPSPGSASGSNKGHDLSLRQA